MRHASVTVKLKYRLTGSGQALKLAYKSYDQLRCEEYLCVTRQSPSEIFVRGVRGGTREDGEIQSPRSALRMPDEASTKTVSSSAQADLTALAKLLGRAHPHIRVLGSVLCSVTPATSSVW